MRRSSVLVLVLVLLPLTLAASPARPPGQLLVDLAGDANGVNVYTHGVMGAGMPTGVSTAPAQVATADLISGRLLSRWTGSGDDRSLSAIEVRLRTSEAGSKVPIYYVSWLAVDGCSLGVIARVGTSRPYPAAAVTVWTGDERACGTARGRVFRDGALTRSWDNGTTELVVSLDLRRGPRALREILHPGATVRWESSSTEGSTPTGMLATIDVAWGEGTWVIPR